MPANRRTTSDISCWSCRRRKVKCDRRFPQCLVCEQTAQDCNYPPGPMKPGPKIGSKRSREDDFNNEGTHDASIQRLDRASESPERPAPDTASELPYLEREPSAPTGESQGRSRPADGREESMRRISDLSFILHPAHETSSPDKERASDTRPPSGDRRNSAALTKACSVLNLRQGALEHLVTTYFDNMVAINLFHEPSFYEKLSNIASPTQICALLTALRSFAVRFHSDEGDESGTHERAAYYLDLAAGYITEALKECGDLTPPMCILQASIVSAHCQLSQGVLGKAWRSLGTCVRLAYEMNLHLVDVGVPHDAGEAHAERWCEDEEKRRAWWAIWEMDVFATTIRRTPTAVDWSQIDTLLPVEDSCWFQRKPRPSCFLERDPICRWKALQRSGNQSPKAWFIVINSLMKEAQQISSPRGVPSASVDRRNERHHDRINAARRKLEVIENAVQCFRLALPTSLKYDGQYLGFEGRIPGQYTSMRQEHSSIYNIYMMTQLARLMIHRFDAFGKRFRTAITSHDLDGSGDRREQVCAQERKDMTESLAIKQYFEAADDQLLIVRRSCDDHVRYINPFLSNTIWLASAVLLVRSQFCRPEATRSVIKSRYEVMHLTYKKCVHFWDMHTAVQQNFGTLEQQLEACQRPDRCEQEPPRKHRAPSKIHGRDGPVNSTRRPRCNHRQLSQAPRGNSDSTHSHAPNPGSIDANCQIAQPPPSPPLSHGFLQAAWPQTRQGDVLTGRESPDASGLDFMHLTPLQHMDLQPSASDFAGHSPAGMVEPVLGHAAQSSAPQFQNTGEPNMDFDLDWAYPRLPSDLQNMLSGFLQHDAMF